jgi:hypothetical protein
MSEAKRRNTRVFSSTPRAQIFFVHANPVIRLSQLFAILDHHRQIRRRGRASRRRCENESVGNSRAATRDSKRNVAHDSTARPIRCCRFGRRRGRARRGSRALWRVRRRRRFMGLAHRGIVVRRWMGGALCLWRFARTRRRLRSRRRGGRFGRRCRRRGRRRRFRHLRLVGRRCFLRLVGAHENDDGSHRDHRRESEDQGDLGRAPQLPAIGVVFIVPSSSRQIGG